MWVPCTSSLSDDNTKPRRHRQSHDHRSSCHQICTIGGKIYGLDSNFRKASALTGRVSLCNPEARFNIATVGDLTIAWNSVSGCCRCHQYAPSCEQLHPVYRSRMLYLVCTFCCLSEHKDFLHRFRSHKEIKDYLKTEFFTNFTGKGSLCQTEAEISSQSNTGARTVGSVKSQSSVLCYRGSRTLPPHSGSSLRRCYQLVLDLH